MFNGVLYFAGNARVSGIIPTDVQITLVSNATIYIDNSITKGVSLNGVLLTRPSKSMMILMAKDYVTLNTTQFFGPAAGQPIEPAGDTPNSNGFAAIRVRQPNGQLAMDSIFARDPIGPAAQPGNPSTTRPYAMDYTEDLTPAVKIPTSIFIAHAADDGPTGTAMIQMDVNFRRTG